MYIVTAFLLAFALCADTLAVSTASAFSSKMSWRRGILLALVFAVFQGGFPFLGALLGAAFRDLMASLDHWIAFALLLFVGGKMIVDGLRNAPREEQLDVSRLGVLCLLGMATSIDAFVVGIGLGFDYSFLQTVAIAAIIGGVTFLVAILGVFLGKRNVPISGRIANVLAGLVLVGLGTFTLVEHLSA